MSQGYCALGPGCLRAQRGAEGAAAPGGALCTECERAARADVLELVSDYAMLSDIVGSQSATTDVKIARPKPESSPPINLHIDALRSQIVWSTTLWEDVLRDLDNLSPRTSLPVRAAFAVTNAVAIIAPRVDMLAGLPAVDCYAYGPDELVTRTGLQGLSHLRRLHRAAITMTGRAPRVVRLPGECPTCASRNLRRDDGSDTVYCGTCDWRTTEQDYRAYVQLNVMVDGGPSPD